MSSVVREIASELEAMVEITEVEVRDAREARRLQFLGCRPCVSTASMRTGRPHEHYVWARLSNPRDLRDPAARHARACPL